MLTARITPYNDADITAIFDVSNLKKVLLSQKINVNSKNEIINEPIPYDNTSGIVADPVLDPIGGEYTDTVKVMITCSTEGATIRYTLDGTDPGPTNGTILDYDYPISIYNQTLKAIAYRKGWAPSKIISGVYVMKLGF